MNRKSSSSFAVERSPAMKVVVNRYAVRLSNRVPETIAALCLLVGFVVCGLILSGRSSASPTPAEAATTRSVNASIAPAKAKLSERAVRSEYAAARAGLR
jgi:hypothetical protein